MSNRKLAERLIETSVEQQKTMFYNAGTHATQSGLQKLIDDLNKKRFQMVKDWRANGMKDEDWEKVEELDKVIDKQEDVFATLSSHKWGEGVQI